MAEQFREMEIEEKKAAVNEWVASFTETGILGEMDPSLLKDVLASSGADFEQSSENLASLGEYTNKAKRLGLNAVWGKETVDTIWKQIDNYIEEYEEQTGTTLPKLVGFGCKFSGMRQYIGELTAYAAGQLSFKNFKKYSEVRIFNGKMWKQGRKDERIRIKVPRSNKKILPSSYPPEFPQKAFEIINSLSNK
jgi:hypothetical protein